MKTFGGAFWRRLVLIAVAHAIIAFLFWSWMAGVALGLGFKDKLAWSLWDHIQAAVVPPVALTLSLPGRLFLVKDGPDLVFIFLANSLLWSLGITSIYSLMKAAKLPVFR